MIKSFLSIFLIKSLLKNIKIEFNLMIIYQNLSYQSLNNHILLVKNDYVLTNLFKCTKIIWLEEYF